ncbi:MAG TPA: hypothetical protein VNL16_10840 [Chloroflexota bacterium]|nr:hypothetical protein [Chloroflexota bacterium]
MDDRIAALARRVQDDPFFLASALKGYARSEGLDERGLAAALSCPIETLVKLALCRRPRPAPPVFREDVDRIATRFGVRADALAEIVRHADALAGMRRGDADERGLLMAARDRDEPTAADATDRQTTDEPR